MIGFKKRSILFLEPDYYHSFFLRDELRKQGWRADVLKPYTYSDDLLYSDDCLREWWFYPLDKTVINKIINGFLQWIRFFYFICSYRYFVVYGNFFVSRLVGSKIRRSLLNRGFALDFWLLRLLGKKIIFIPGGCREELTQADYLEFNPQFCNNCPIQDKCDDQYNLALMSVLNRYGHLIVAMSPGSTKRLNKVMIKYRSLDLDLWKPQLEIPAKFQLPHSNNLRIMHSFYNKKLDRLGRNYKGSPFVHNAVEKLRAEGYPVEYFFVNNVRSRHMRFYQAQADIIVEQLLFGWWGSTGVETMSLGKPVVCYLHPDMKRAFLDHFKEYRELPIVEASTETVYEVLKRLVVDSDYRRQKGAESRKFAESHFDMTKNATGFASHLESL